MRAGAGIVGAFAGLAIFGAMGSGPIYDAAPYSRTAPGDLIVSAGNGSGTTRIAADDAAAGDMAFYADGTICCYLDESASNFTLQNFNLNFAATNRTIRNGGGAVEFQANHSPTAASTNDISVEDGAEFNWSHGRTKSADPCSSAGDSSVPDSAIYMSSGGFPCYCDAAGADKLVSSNADCTY